jgi:hypothetical protein
MNGLCDKKPVKSLLITGCRSINRRLVKSRLSRLIFLFNKEKEVEEEGEE